MESDDNVIRGMLMARSPPMRSEEVSTLMELQISSGDRLKIIVPKLYLPANLVVPGNSYKFTNLKILKCKLFLKNYTVYFLDDLSQIQAEPLDPQTLLAMNSGLWEHSFSGKVIAIDRLFHFYKLESGDYLVLSFLKMFCEMPVLEVGFSVDVKLAHRWVDRQGNVYYVLCLRSFIFFRQPMLRRRNCDTDHYTIFVLFAELYGLTFQELLWLRESLDIVKSCVTKSFLESRGAPNTSLVYADVVMMLLSFNEGVKKKIVSSSDPNHLFRNSFEEFFREPHTCMFTKQDVQLPSKPRSVKDCLYLQDVEHDDVDKWNFHIRVVGADEPILAYVEISNKSRRLCLTDGSGVALTLMLVQDKKSISRDCSSLHGKIVVVKKALLVVETYLEDKEMDPASEELPKPTHTFVYLMSRLDDIEILGPGQGGFSEWTETRISEYVNPQNFGVVNRPLLALQMNSPSLQAYSSERYLVLHKTPLELHGGTETRTYLMVKKVPSGVKDGTSGMDACYTFFWLSRPHTDFYELIPSSGEIEVRFPEGKADVIKNRRRDIPNTWSIRNKLKTIRCVMIPAEVEIYVVAPSCTIPSDIFSLSEAIEEPQCSEELVSISGKIVRRNHEKAKYHRETQKSSYNENFGLPGEYSVIVLDLCDISDKTGARVYVSWLNSHQYPLGVLPGASIVMSFVYSRVSNGKTYFRSTNLSTIEIVEAAPPDGGVNTDLVELPSGWTYPKDLPEGGGGWCMIDSMHLIKLDVDTVCQTCGEPCRQGYCTFVGCSSPVGPKLKISARVRTFSLGSQYSIFIRDDQARLLFQVPEEVWEALLVLINFTGPLNYYMGKTSNFDLEKDSLQELVESIFTEFAETVVDFGQQLPVLCRRFKNNSACSSYSAEFFCANVAPICLKRTLKLTASRKRTARNPGRCNPGGSSR